MIKICPLSLKRFDIWSRREDRGKVDFSFLGVNTLMETFKSISLQVMTAFFSTRFNVSGGYVFVFYIYIFQNILSNDLEIFQHNFSAGTCSRPSRRITHP